MSGSSLDGLDIAYAEFHESRGKWEYAFFRTACYEYDREWISKLSSAAKLGAKEYLLLHTEYGRYLGGAINKFINENDLHYQVHLIASHGHTVFHEPPHMTSQLGDGAAIAAVTGVNVVSDLRSMDVALGGQGAPIIPIGEKLLFSEYDLFLNLGGIANISCNDDQYIAFDVCPCNRVLNMLAADRGLQYDAEGKLAAAGKVNETLLATLDEQEYYRRPHPKSLSNDFGTDVIYPLIKNCGISTEDALRTYAQHISGQIRKAVNTSNKKMLVTGGGAFNTFLVERIMESFKDQNIEIEVPGNMLVNFKEALVMGLIGVLRLRQENNVLATVTGASRNSIGGALWMGQEA